MASKVSKGEVAAVFYINPQPENAAGVMELIATCAKRKVYIAFNIETADCILGRVGTCTSRGGFCLEARSCSDQI
jgi:hypothetical protein